MKYINNVIVCSLLPVVEFKVPVPGVAKWLLNTRLQAETAYLNMIKGDHFLDLVKINTEFRHFGNIIFYESPDAQPIILNDEGEDCKTPSGADRKLFNTYSYVFDHTDGREAMKRVKKLGDAHTFFPGALDY